MDPGEEDAFTQAQVAVKQTQALGILTQGQACELNVTPATWKDWVGACGDGKITRVPLGF